MSWLSQQEPREAQQPVGPEATAAAVTLSYPVPRLALAAGIAFAGDQLFYSRAVGISFALFLALIAATAVCVVRSRRPGRRDLAITLGLVFVGMAPLIESVGPLSALSGVAGLALALSVLSGELSRGPAATATAAADIIVRGPFNLPRDGYAIAGQVVRESRMPRVATVIGWLVPLVLCAVFVCLFSAANPILAAWTTDFPWSALIPGFDVPRSLAWLLLLTFAWAFIAPKFRQRPDRTAGVTMGPGSCLSRAELSRLLDDSTVLRCLVLFNLLFAFQSCTDVAYLWAGLALPPGMTHAAYAHRGAYPLIATALLAAGFVLTTLRAGGTGERSVMIRSLLCFWIAQNVLLVASAMLRLDLYVETYGLSLLRMAALIWMALVGAGLTLILVRLVLHRSNDWLVRSNAVALAATLYVCAFIDFSGTVANYNASHRFEAGAAFDLPYAMSLGAAAIPAIDDVLVNYDGPLAERARVWRWRQAMDLRQRMKDWRSWTFRDQRLLGYIDAHPDALSPVR